MKSPLQHIIFDFDGVIADTFDINWALSQEHDQTATLEDFLLHHDGNVFEEPRIKFDPERVHLFYSEYQKRLLPSHVARALEPLKRLGKMYSLYIISSTGEQAISQVLELVDLGAYFKRVLGAQTHKSKVEKFKMLMTENGVTIANTIFVTDTLGDIREATKVGIRTIAETFGFHNRERLKLGDPFRIVDSWEEIEAVVHELAQ